MSTPYDCGLADDPGLTWEAYHEAEAMAPEPPPEAAKI